ncbi:transporter substrate-binding domain-containing protein [Marinobacter sp. M216]|uniref:Transporter substrate-binding domain-containing protein n=1 Tax=Marinobacter albus TaxID=3030833 RepID=A0ABT7H7A4_9GAMM|nr:MULTISPECIES: transporter substrate-binding domain-containing protein [unclassified Marinobacter]MBW7471484.1 transporter substrate-binding domain-containing protein [Marinobacter sp. F4218]MDK9556238.1 transporter substrate-binding domain-containing protein [Marinobacter sp. M216]
MSDWFAPRSNIIFIWLGLTILSALGLCVPRSTLSAEELASEDTVSVGIVADNKPYSFFEGRTTSGFSPDILKEIEANSGIKFEYRAGNWPELYEAFLDGRLDVIDAISYREDQTDRILFTEPYHIRQTFLMQDGTHPIGDVESLADLKDLTVGVVEDVYYRDLLVENGIDVRTYDSIPSLVRALAFQWVDVIMGPRLSLKYQANIAGLYFLSIAGPAPLGPKAQEDLRIGVRKDNPELFRRIQLGLKAIPESRKMELLQRWREFGGTSINETLNFKLTDEERLFISRLGPVRVGLMPDYAPFSFKAGGKLQGLSVDVLNRLADLTGLQVIPVSGAWSELVPMLRDGTIDVLGNMSLTEERQTFARFTEPYYLIPNVVFTRDGGLEYNGLESLSGYTVGISSDIYYETEVVQALGDSAKVFDSQEAMFQSLEHDRVDVVLAALPNGNFWIQELRIPGVRIAGELVFEDHPGEDLRFGVRASLAPLAEILDQALAAISPTEMRTIEDRWLGASAAEESLGPAKLSLSPDEQAWLDERDRNVSYCIDNDWMPLEGLDSSGEHEGLSAETFRLFSERGNIQFQLVKTDSWPESLEAVRERRCDMLALAMKTPERAQYLNFTTPYLQVPNIILGRIEAPFIENVGDLRNKRVGVVKDYAFSELLKYRYPGMQLVEVENETKGMKLLQDNELAGYVTTLATASYHMQELGLADLKVIGRIPADWSLSVASRSDEPVLHDIMQKLVDSLTPEERSGLESYWRNIKIEQSVDYRLVWQLVGIAIIGAALLFYWNRKLNRLNRQLASANDALARLSVTDDLTQLGNRSYFDREFRKSFQWCQRNRDGFAVAMVDADLFKSINDTFGHDAGDHCLKTLAEMMKRHFRRETDRLSRFGGEEFVIFTTYQDRREIIERLDRFRNAIADSPTVFSGQEIHLTVSIGLATGIPEPSDSPAAFLRLADQALYCAKENGRNRLEVRAIKQ